MADQALGVGMKSSVSRLTGIALVAMLAACGGNPQQPADMSSGDIEVAQPDGAVYLLYSLWVEEGEQIDDVLETQLDGARRVSEVLTDYDLDADTYCVGHDLLVVAVPDGPRELDDASEHVHQALRGDFVLSISAATVADLASDSWVGIVQCQASDGQIVRQGGSGTFP